MFSIEPMTLSDVESYFSCSKTFLLASLAPNTVQTRAYSFVFEL